MKNRESTIYHQSLRLMPGGVNSPVRSFQEMQREPMIVCSGKGDTIYNVEGKAFIDFCMSWGALILGHAPDPIATAASKRLFQGATFGIATEEEFLLAKEIHRLIPSLEKIRFVSTGTEATMTAIRLARAYTRKTDIIKFEGNYHGHSDALLVKAGSGVTCLPEASSAGVPPEVIRHTLSLPYNDEQKVTELFAENPHIAAVIVEPIAANMGVIAATASFLRLLRRETKKANALLIFDEVVTGFRVGLSGAQGLYNITPDLTCLGKIIGGGFPAAAVGGRREIIDLLAPMGPVYQAGTFSGHPVAMRAGLETLKLLQVPHFYEELEKKTSFLTASINEISRVGSMFTLFLGPDRYRKFFSYLYEQGIYFPPSQYEACFVSSAHTYENLTKTKECILRFLSQEVLPMHAAT